MQGTNALTAHLAANCSLVFQPYSIMPLERSTNLLMQQIAENKGGRLVRGINGLCSMIDTRGSLFVLGLALSVQQQVPFSHWSTVNATYTYFWVWSIFHRSGRVPQTIQWISE